MIIFTYYFAYIHARKYIWYIDLLNFNEKIPYKPKIIYYCGVIRSA